MEQQQIESDNEKEDETEDEKETEEFVIYKLVNHLMNKSQKLNVLPNMESN